MEIWKQHSLKNMTSIRLCKDLGYHNDCIETNSEMVVGWLRANICSTWYLWNFWELLEEELEGLQFTIMNKFWEENQVVNFLDYQVEGGITKRYLACDEMPSNCRVIFIWTSWVFQAFVGSYYFLFFCVLLLIDGLVMVLFRSGFLIYCFVSFVSLKK